MEELQAKALARTKRERRHRHEAKQKSRVRAAQMALGVPLLEIPKDEQCNERLTVAVALDSLCCSRVES